MSNFKSGRFCETAMKLRSFGYIAGCSSVKTCHFTMQKLKERCCRKWQICLDRPYFYTWLFHFYPGLSDWIVVICHWIVSAGPPTATRKQNRPTYSCARLLKAAKKKKDCPMQTHCCLGSVLPLTSIPNLSIGKNDLHQNGQWYRL